MITTTVTDRTLNILNAVPVALHHYQMELESVLASAGRIAWTSVEVDSAEVGSSGIARKAFAAGRHLRTMRAVDGSLIDLWPVLGHLESFGAKHPGAAIVHHDPIPIREQFGHSRWAVNAGVAHARRSGSVVVAHSRAAEHVLREMGYPDVRVVPHPMVQPLRRPTPSTSTVRVLGQYKPARDLELLSFLGPELRARGFEPEIVGRGWPEVEGWSVRDEFVSEQTMTELIGTAGVVLIPYSRFWQSGIAIRAFESGTPVVGAGGGFLSELYSGDESVLVKPDARREDWLQATELAFSDGTSLVHDSADRYRFAAVTAWAELADHVTTY